MEKLKLPEAVTVSRTSSRNSVMVRQPTIGRNLPEITNPQTDIELPRLWSAWVPVSGARTIRRSLTDNERAALVARRDALLPFVSGYLDEERDQIAVSIGGMFGGYRSMRQDDRAAAAIIAGTLNLVREFPAWAIVKACDSIRRNGIWKPATMKYDRTWPPNDAEIIAAVRDELRLIEPQYRRVASMLTAEVESK
jgi:hypothetical protein